MSYLNDIVLDHRLEFAEILLIDSMELQGVFITVHRVINGVFKHIDVLLGKALKCLFKGLRCAECLHNIENIWFILLFFGPLAH